MYIQIKDNGDGFDVAQVVKGNGIDNMQRRAKVIHAQFDLISEPGEGTNITINIPL